MLSEAQKEALDSLFVDTTYSAMVDSEVTLNGNGVNAHEAMQVMEAVYAALEVETPGITKEGFTEWCDYYGLDPEEYEEFLEDF